MIVYLSSREVLSGVTDRLATWKARGWKTAKGKQVAHHDEWRKVNEWHTALSRYCPITYEWIHRDQNEACEICKEKRDWIQMEHACQWALDNDPELRKEMETEARTAQLCMVVMNVPNEIATTMSGLVSAVIFELMKK